MERRVVEPAIACSLPAFILARPVRAMAPIATPGQPIATFAGFVAR
jgi:hypothetical protein